MEGGESIDIVEFLRARAREVEAIEKSIAVSHKQSLAWQRLPHYRRRRSRNFDKRLSRRPARRPKDRHALRTHTYYAKRFFMLRLSAFGIPLRRRVKSMKYIYRSQGRGFVFDESFRGVRAYRRADVLGLAALGGVWAGVDLDRECVVQYADGRFEVVADGEQVLVVGEELPVAPLERLECCVSVMLREDLVFRDSQSFRTYRAADGQGGLETHKIVCRRSEVMMLFQSLVNASLIPVCLEEVHRLALENDAMSVYDRVGSPLFGLLEERLVADAVAKYNRTPPAKRPPCPLERLSLQGEKVGRYFFFRMPRGAAAAAAEVLCGGACVGRVVRGGYKFSSARCCGLAFFYGDDVPADGPLECRNLTQQNMYPLEIVRLV